MTKRILLVFGTRPEAIKMAPLARTLQAQSAFEVKVCVAAQHRRMLDQVLHLFEIQPDFELDLTKPGQDIYDLTSQILLGLKQVLTQWRPDALLVHGDSSSTFAASLAAFYQHIPVGHVEAGLRASTTHGTSPQDASRKLTTALAHWHFTPTATTQANLLQEGVAPGTIHVTGNTVIDALLQVREKIFGNGPLQRQFRKEFSFLEPSKRLLLVTCHRRENFDQGFEHICQALARIAQRHPDVQLVYPVQPNAHVRDPVRRLLGSVANVRLLEPLDYLRFVYLMGKSSLILTESGGIQEEAPALGKPVLVMRETTERPEAVQAGTVRLIGTDADEITAQASTLLSDADACQTMAFARNPYGDGHACERIAQALGGDKRLFFQPARNAMKFDAPPPVPTNRASPSLCQAAHS